MIEMMLDKETQTIAILEPPKMMEFRYVWSLLRLQGNIVYFQLEFVGELHVVKNNRWGPGPSEMETRMGQPIPLAPGMSSLIFPGNELAGH